jgi:hypothetical protein
MDAEDSRCGKPYGAEDADSGRHASPARRTRPVVEKLTDEDFVSIAAYLSSRTP